MLNNSDIILHKKRVKFNVSRERESERVIFKFDKNERKREELRY